MCFMLETFSGGFWISLDGPLLIYWLCSMFTCLMQFTVGCCMRKVASQVVLFQFWAFNARRKITQGD